MIDMDIILSYDKAKSSKIGGHQWKRIKILPKYK